MRHRHGVTAAVMATTTSWRDERLRLNRAQKVIYTPGVANRAGTCMASSRWPGVAGTP